MNTKKTIDHWSRYWQTGHLTSLPDDFRSLYDEEIEAFWAGLAAGLPDGAKVLDVCAGNGPVALLMARHAKGAQVWAADAADIDPAGALSAHAGLAELADRITFLPRTATEELAGLEPRFDLVTSQYGVEYTHWTRSAQAIAAVLKPGGQFALIAHVPTSAMVESMEAEQREYALLSETGALGFLQKLGEEGIGSARKGLKRATLRLRAQTTGSALLTSFTASVSALLAMQPQALHAQQPAIRQYASDIVAGRDRTADLLQTNQRILEEPRWFEVFSDAGLELLEEQEILYRGQHRCGLALLFCKPRG
jgi:SAM-dependent methyltransferase